MLQKGCDLQIAVFLYLSLFWSTTIPPRHPHRNNDAILLPRQHRNNASILLPRQHHTAAIFMRPPTIASTSSSSSGCNTTPKGRRNRRPRLLVLVNMPTRVCNARIRRETRLLFARPMGRGGSAHRAPGSGTLGGVDKRNEVHFCAQDMLQSTSTWTWKI